MIEEDDNCDAFLLEAMICSICFTIFNEPKQLQCGHSFCAICIDQLYKDVEQEYTCPLCRAHFTIPPVINYSLKSLVSRIKERDAMIKHCQQCSRVAKPEDQYCCDDCDHIDRIEHVRCGLCVINGHAKMGHTISKYGESKERIKTAQQTLQEMITETLQLLKECKKLGTDRLSCVENLFKLLDEQYAQFQGLEIALNDGGFISKKDIEMKLEHARQLREIYMRSTSEFATLMNTMFNEITVLTERTGVELASHAAYKDIIDKRGLTAQSAQEQKQSWFEYQRNGRVSALCSVIARRNATIARRHLMTFNENSESESSMDITSSTSTASVTSSLPVSSNQAILAHQT
uniref:RING-type domain-containing protein n=2 Tax=Wuchereria bancrofti TaxID=6293 RepID=A0AAF5Q415_WUCBA